MGAVTGMTGVGKSQLVDRLTRRSVGPSVDESLERLRTDYVDLLLIHWPNKDVPLFETLGLDYDKLLSRMAR